MAMRVPQYEQKQVVQVQAPVPVAARQSGVGALAPGLADAGAMFDQWQKDVDEANAKRADTDYSDLVRKTLYEDGSGYLYAQGGDALARRQEAAETLQKAFDERLQGLSPAARAMAEQSMESRRQTALTTVDRHAGGERVGYLNGQADARIKSAVDDAIVDPAMIGRSLQIAKNEIAETGARMGWSPEQTAQKVSEAEGTIHGGVVSRLANVNPKAALDYLNAHRDVMSAGDVVRLEGALVPEVKRATGREAGRQLALGSMSGQIPAGYYDATMGSESGGRGDAKNPNSSATGFFQWTDGTWAEMVRKHPDLGLTMDGRGNRAQEQRAVQRFTEQNARTLVRGGVAITHGTLYAAHFLGAGGALQALRAPLSAMMTEVVPAAVIRANSFLANMSVADFTAWAERKGGGDGAAAPAGGGQQRVNPVWSILQMDDPDERAAAMQEYQLWSGQIAADAKRRQDGAQQAGFVLIEQGGDVDSLTLEQKMAIGQEGMSSLRTYQNKVRAGDPPTTDPELFVELSREAAGDPRAFAARDPLEWRNRLSDADFKSFVQKQVEAITGGGGNPLTVSTINTVAKEILPGAGIDPSKKSGAAKMAQLQENLLRWSQTFQTQNNRLPSHLEIREQANSLLLPVVIDPPGWLNQQSGSAFEMDFDDITPADILDGSLRIGGEKIPPERIEAFVREFEAALGRAPTPQEVVEGLAWAATR